MSHPLRITPFILLAALAGLPGCAMQPGQPAAKTQTQGPADLQVSAGLFRLPFPNQARATWMAYGGGRLLWERAHYKDEPAGWSYRDTPDEEQLAMDLLGDSWSRDKQHKSGDDSYLDTVAAVRDAGYVGEYVWSCLSAQDWGTPPADLRTAAFQDWMLAHATNFNVYRSAEPKLEGGKLDVAIHEPIAIGYCLPAKAVAPGRFDLPEADAALEAAVKLQQQGGSEQLSKLIDQAVTLYESAIAKQPGIPRCFHSLAEYYGYRNMHPDEKTLVVDASYCEAVYLQGYLKSGMQQWDAARAILQRGHELAPYDPEFVTEQGYITQAVSGPGQAVTVYLSALKLAEADTEQRSAMTGILRRLGEAYIDLKKYDDARDALDTALATDPDDAGTKRELQYLDQVTGKH